MKLKLMILSLLALLIPMQTQPMVITDLAQKAYENPYTLPVIAGTSVALIASHYWMKSCNNAWIDKTIAEKEQELDKKKQALDQTLPTIEKNERCIIEDYNGLYFSSCWLGLKRIQNIEDPGSINGIPITIDYQSRWFRTLSNFFNSTATIKNDHPQVSRLCILADSIKQYNKHYNQNINNIRRYQSIIALHNPFYETYARHSPSIACFIKDNEKTSNANLIESTAKKLVSECSPEGNYPFISASQKMDKNLNTLERKYESFIEFNNQNQNNHESINVMQQRIKFGIDYLKEMNLLLKQTDTFKNELPYYNQEKASNEFLKQKQQKIDQKQQEINIQRMKAQAEKKHLEAQAELAKKQAALTDEQTTAQWRENWVKT